MAQAAASPPYHAPFQLLELNIMSGQDLKEVSRKMKTYAVVWINPERKLYTRIDTNGHNNPTWNDKFVFRVDNNFLYDDLSAINIEIYAANWWRNVFVGSVRLLVGNLLEAPNGQYREYGHFLGMHFVALQVRRPSSRLQGILNIGLALLDSSMRSMPLYSHGGTSAVAYRDLMGREYPLDNNQHDFVRNNNEARELRRTKSDTSSMIVPNIKGGVSMMDDDVNVVKGRRGTTSSWVSGSGISDFRGKNFKAAGSMVSGSVVSDYKGKKIKNGSCVSGSDIGYMQKFARANSFLSASDAGRHGRASSSITGQEVSFPTKKGKTFGNQEVESRLLTINELVNLRKDDQSQQNGSEIDWPKPRTFTKLNGSDVNGPIITQSELGPSPSEVAAAIERDSARHGDKHQDSKNSSSSALKWSLDTNVEGLQSKLARWRTELPPVHDQSDFSSLSSVPYSGISGSSGNASSKHRRRHTDGEGLISCFGNLCGVQVSIVCGAPSNSAKKKDKSP